LTSKIIRRKLASTIKFKLKSDEEKYHFIL